jgi:hypothetical protein
MAETRQHISDIVKAGRMGSQAVSVQQGNTHIKNRVVCLFDADARSIAIEKLRAPVEFGAKLQDC